MLKSRGFQFFIAGLTTLVALILLLDRGGLIAWSALIIGIGLLGKIWLKPSTGDLGLCVGMVAIPVFAWVGTLYHVISTWESGEVVELAIDTRNGVYTTRVWVLDIGAHPVVYYDAPPQVAESLLAGEPLQFRRADEVSTRIPRATQADALTEDKAALVLEAMASKYESRVDAADIYYLMLGRSRDRVALIAELVESRPTGPDRGR